MHIADAAGIYTKAALHTTTRPTQLDGHAFDFTLHAAD